MRGPVLRAFHNQCSSAKQRGISFHFTFEEWCLWWYRCLGDDWFTLRGPRHGQYVMARDGDVGPYIFWNVECKLAQDNITERARRIGPKSKLSNAQVVDIYNSYAKVEKLARLYGVDVTTIKRIRSGRARGRATQSLRTPYQIVP